ncbi:Ribosome-recycling factor [Citrus sinensis]|uniref:Ribosome-recycling factor n=1 Tax=Citrus sinensis TaxID=2711 RepID=A0ACB8MJ90_CITSI|nr:Ribosome-recycling factor [Citrus sinensis]
MATHFSSTGPMRSIFQLKSNPPKCLLFLPDSCHRRAETATCRASSVSVRQWSSAANYSRLVKLSNKPIVKARMERTIDMVRTNFNSVRTGRSNPAMLDKIEVEYYGSPVSLKSIAQINTPDSSSLLIQPYDKSSLKSIEKAIVSSDLGMTPNNDGEVIRLTLPQLTSERRKELSKVVAKQAEEGKVAVRNIRRDALKAYEKLQKEKKLSEDNVKDLSSDLQKLTDEYMKKIDSIYKQKEKELLKV